MAILEIITPENNILREKAEEITNINDEELQRLIDNMIETMIEAPGVGLAAPQVAQKKRLIVVRLPDDEQSVEEYGNDAGVLHVVINPEIVRKSRTKIDGVEACLSIPGYFGNVERHTAVTIEGLDREGNEIKIKARDWLARVFQHEIDHLDGILFTDLATEVWQSGEEETEEIAE